MLEYCKILWKDGAGLILLDYSALEFFKEFCMNVCCILIPTSVTKLTGFWSTFLSDWTHWPATLRHWVYSATSSKLCCKLPWRFSNYSQYTRGCWSFPWLLICTPWYLYIMPYNFVLYSNNNGQLRFQPAHWCTLFFMHKLLHPWWDLLMRKAHSPGSCERTSKDPGRLKC